jgi:peptidoglycan-N-acetylglucosamine deacetylase
MPIPRISLATLGRMAFPRYIWRMPDKNKNIYLTFDDGPVPVVTEWVLDLLKSRKILATFFCVGDNVRKYPEIYSRILDEGHSVGNHTYNHLNGWKNSLPEYRRNIASAEKEIQSGLFRPPYGKIRPMIGREISNRYKIIMWDVLSRDFDSAVSGDKCAAIVLAETRPGSIIVFHDSPKSKTNLMHALPICIDTLKERGYKFEPIVF